jgi:hypothetical protein
MFICEAYTSENAVNQNMRGTLGYLWLDCSNKARHIDIAASIGNAAVSWWSRQSAEQGIMSASGH